MHGISWHVNKKCSWFSIQFKLHRQKSDPFQGCLCVFQLQFLADDRCSEIWLMCGESNLLKISPLSQGRVPGQNFEYESGQNPEI